jgi:hypothetical protein
MELYHELQEKYDLYDCSSDQIGIRTDTKQLVIFDYGYYDKGSVNY